MIYGCYGVFPASIELKKYGNALFRGRRLDVKQRFTGYKDQAEHGYKQALLLHYSKLEIKLKGNLEAIIQEMEETAREASQPERNQHRNALQDERQHLEREGVTGEKEEETGVPGAAAEPRKT